LVNQSVSEPAVEYPIFLPLSWSMVLIGDRSRGFADGDHRRALGDQRHFRPGAVADVERTGGHGLSHSAAAGEIDDLQVEPVFLEDAELLADIDRNDRVGVRRRLADRKRCGRGRRDTGGGQHESKCGNQAAARRISQHGFLRALVRRICCDARIGLDGFAIR
jgi:hypothetical protein